MTLQLRRKHPITPPNIRRAKTSDLGSRARALALPDRRAGIICWLAMLLAATLALLAWLPAARGDDGDAQGPSDQNWQRPLRRTAGPAAAIVGTDTVSSGAKSTAPAVRPARRKNPIGRFDWGDLGLKDNAPSADAPPIAKRASSRNKASDSVRQVQALLPANEPGSAQPAAAGTAPAATNNAPAAGDVAADEPRQLDSAGSDEQAAIVERLAQRPVGPNVPAFEDTFGQGPQSLEVNCDVERQKLKPINAVTNKITAEPGAFPPECGIGDLKFQTRDFSPMTYTWVASNLCHKPLYFEQPRLERYGHSLPPVIQPVVSAALFFATVPLLPYKMGIEPPNECIYVLGYYRPNSCAPMQIPGVAISLRGAIFEAAVITGFAVVLPP